MMSSLKALVIFAAGVVTGVAATWKYVSDKERKRADDDILEMREYYKKKTGKGETVKETPEDKEEEVEEENEEPKEVEKNTLDFTDDHEDYVEADMKEYQDIADKYTSQYSDIPLSISPDEFGEIPYYSTVFLSYHPNDVLSNMQNKLEEDGFEKIGRDNLKHMGEYDDDILYIRNDELETYYEVSNVVDEFYEDKE